MHVSILRDRSYRFMPGTNLNEKVKNSYMEKFGKETVEKFICTTGVKERRSAIRLQTASDLCYVAAKELIQFKQYGAESIDGVILITQFPDYDTPATAHILHKRLNLTNNCIAMDINLGCSGFVYGINIAASLIKSGALQRIVLWRYTWMDNSRR